MIARLNSSRLVSALLLICLLVASASSEHVQHDHAVLRSSGLLRSATILDKAISKASTLASPEPLFKDIADAAVAVLDVKDAYRLIDRMATHLKKWEKHPDSWPKTRVNAFVGFAQCVAPFSRDRRDGYLVRGLNRSKHQSPDDEHLARMLAFEQGLWRAILLSRQQPEQGLEKLQALLLKARKHGDFGRCATRNYEMELLAELTRLDPELMIKAWPKKNREHLPAYCLRKARELHEHTYRRTNRFSELLLAYAVRNAKLPVKVLRLYKFYDIEDSYARAAKLPADHPLGAYGRGWAMSDILGYWAWRNPERALELAEREKDPKALRDAIQGVSTTWAYLRPEQIERAIRKQDNPVRRGWARRIAAEELSRRNEGKPPTDSPAAFCRGDSPRSVTRARFACSPEDKKRRIRKLLEVIRSSEDDTLYELSCLFMYDKALAMKTLKPNKYYASRQAALARMIHFMGYWGDHGIGEDLLEELEDPRQYVWSACQLARHAVERCYVRHGKGRPRSPRYVE